MHSVETGTVPGLFFSFEGIDGSGKSTQARMLADALRARGHTIVTVREPGGTALGERIRALLLDPASEIVPRAELLLFAAARAQLVDTVIEPALAQGHHVIADRYVDSTDAYQGAGRQLNESVELDALHQIATGGRLPDRTYLVLLSVKEAQRRRQNRAADRMEQPSEGFWERTTSAYQQLSESPTPRVLTLDGAQSVPAIHRVIREDALALIG